MSDVSIHCKGDTILEQTFELRDYQSESIKRILASYEKDPTGQELIVLPTAAGKTIVFAEIIRRLGNRALVLAHRDELLEQAADKYCMMHNEADVGKIGGGVFEWDHDVLVGSIDTLRRANHTFRLVEEHEQRPFKLVVIDEAHHIAANGYQHVLTHLPGVFRLLVTATPDRLDGKPIIDKKPIYIRTIPDMIERRWLCDIRAIAIRTETSLDNIKTTGGDYNLGDLGRAVDTHPRNARIVSAYQEHAAGRKFIAFCATIAHAEHLAEAFQAAHIPVHVVTGETSLEERKRMYQDVRTGKVFGMINVLVLTEGFDMPQISCIIMARPTQSRALFVQCLGRGTRLSPGKADCILLDLTDNCLKHRLQPQSLQRTLNLPLLRNGTTVLEMLEAEAHRTGATGREVVRKLEDQRHKDVSVDLLAKLVWRELPNGVFTMEIGAQRHRIGIIPAKDRPGLYIVGARLAPKFEFQAWSEPLPLDWAQQRAEKRALLILADKNQNAAIVDRNAPWRNQPATQKQLDLLQRFHQPVWEEMTKGQASDVLDPIFERMNRRRQA